MNYQAKCYPEIFAAALIMIIKVSVGFSSSVKHLPLVDSLKLLKQKKDFSINDLASKQKNCTECYLAKPKLAELFLY